MADTEEPQFNTLAERIAALNKQKNFNSAGVDATRKKAPPPPPPAGRLAPEGRSQTLPILPTTNGSAQKVSPQLPPRPGGTSNGAPPPLPRRTTQNVPQVSTQENGRNGAPAMPSRNGSYEASPSLPPRRPSTLSVQKPSGRRNSASSEASFQSTVSNLSLTKSTSSTASNFSNDGPRNLPPTFDMAKLPPLPPTRRELEAKAQEEAAAKEAARESAVREVANQPARPSLPPRLPSRPGKPQTGANGDTAPRAKPIASQIRGFGGTISDKPPPMPTRPKVVQADDAPPPVPVASRPSAAQVQAIASRPAPKPAARLDCFVCRDWSGPDNVAAQFPRDRLPQNDPIGHLARGLCDQFPSYSDKARAIFTWFHHNISYDTKAFFANDIKPQTPENTIRGGWAVCEGYAKTYHAIAKRAGLDCEVVGGHGKGFGHKALKKGERPPPPKPDGHAWNAVRVDGGEWRLLDACWGAGHICGDNNLYKKEFSPTEFTNSNERFGATHFPTDPRFQFRKDGKPITWEQYYIGRTDGEQFEFFGNGKQEGIAEDSVEPASRQISVNSGQIVRFQFSKLCEHWKSETHGSGKQALFILQIKGVDGRNDDMIPIETDGFWHWVDVHARDLGAPGQEVIVIQLTSIDGQDARGVTAEQFLAKKGRCAMAWGYLARWQLV